MRTKDAVIISEKNLFYLKTNNPKKKGVIIYVHGFCSTYYMHHEFVLMNDFKDYDYFSMNFSGHKIDSDKQELLSEYDVNKYANELIEQILKYDFKNIILIGHSMGGGISLLVYMKLASRIKKIILVNAVNPAIYKSSIGLKYLFSVIRNEPLQIKELETETKFTSNDELRYTIDEYLNYELERFLVKKRKYMFLGVKLISPVFYTKLNYIYKTITIPVLFLSGENDKVIPSKATKKYLANLHNPYIEFQTISNAKHIPFVEAFNEYNEKVWAFINKD